MNIRAAALLLMMASTASAADQQAEVLDCRQQRAKRDWAEYLYVHEKDSDDAERIARLHRDLVRENALAIDLCTREAQEGSVQSMASLAALYYLPARDVYTDTEKTANYRLAEYWFIQAGEGGNEFAQRTLWRSYKRGGRWLKQDLAKARYWEEKYRKTHPQGVSGKH